MSSVAGRVANVEATRASRVSGESVASTMAVGEMGIHALEP